MARIATACEKRFAGSCVLKVNAAQLAEEREGKHGLEVHVVKGENCVKVSPGGSGAVVDVEGTGIQDFTQLLRSGAEAGLWDVEEHLDDSTLDFTNGSIDARLA